MLCIKTLQFTTSRTMLSRGKVRRNGLCYIYIHSALNTRWNLSNLTKQSDFNLYILTMAPPLEPLTTAKNDTPLKTKEFKALIKGVVLYKDVPK
jgi:hypothetical protein